MKKPQLNRYLLCRYEPTPTGKTDKIPLDPKNLYTHNPLDPLIHMPYETARALADTLGEGYGVGYAVLEGDNYFFIDLDRCINPDGTLTETATNTLTYFPTAYVETSQSGRGLHIIGRFEGDAPFDGRRLDHLGIEIYTARRFCALAEINPRGDAETIHTEGLKQFIAALGIDTTPRTERSTEWTTEAAPGTNPPEDNAKLIEFMLTRALTNKEAFGDKLSIRDLWENNVEVLAKHFPTHIVGKEYDYSKADAALAYRLHYFTGGNCERVRELMNLSKLKRDKWNREDYFPPTILRMRGDKFFSHDGTPHTEVENNTPTEQTQHQTASFLSIDQQIAYFQGCTFVADNHQVLTPEGVLYKPETFNVMYGGVTFQLDYTNTKTTRKAFEAFTQCQGHSFPKVDYTCFKPILEPNVIITEDDRRFVNVYRPIDTPRVKASVKLFLKHIEKLIPDENDRLILLSYMASLVQYKGIKFTWCVIVQGAPGNGKTLLNEILAFCMGRRYVHSPASAELAGKFNSWMANNLLITVDDVYQSRWDMIEILKPMITNKYLEIEGKGVNKVTKEICCNFFLCSNHKEGVPKTKDDRRFAPFFTAQQTKEDCERDMGEDYFPILVNWLYQENGLAAINEYLCTFEIPDKYNPTTKCIRAPVTSSTELAISHGLDKTSILIQEWIDEGNHQGFKNGWVSSMAVARKLRHDDHTEISARRLPSLLAAIDYIPHPGLRNGRTSKINTVDNGRPILYIHKSHTETLKLSPLQISDKYENDQN